MARRFIGITIAELTSSPDMPMASACCSLAAAIIFLDRRLGSEI
jgi:hypothetical protein